MHIVVDAIDNTVKFIGYVRMPSYRVVFHSTSFEGVARLVPASGIPDQCHGSRFSVEIGQEYVTDFKILNTLGAGKIDLTKEDGCYRVRGVVHAVMDCSDPPGSRITYVAVGDAIFTLTLADTCGLRPDEGTAVEFIAHDVSLWDDEI